MNQKYSFKLKKLKAIFVIKSIFGILFFIIFLYSFLTKIILLKIFFCMEILLSLNWFFYLSERYK